MSENDNQASEAINSDYELDIDLTQDDTEDIDWKAEAEKAKIFAKQAIARAKTAEAENKTLKGTKPAEVTQLNQPLSADDIDAKILKAKGATQDEIDYLKKLAKVNNTSLIEAESDELFISYKEKKDATAKAEKARLGASKNGGSVKAEKSFNTPTLSDEDHKAMWRQQQG